VMAVVMVVVVTKSTFWDTKNTDASKKQKE
jgi:hypothetical protein